MARAAFHQRILPDEAPADPLRHVRLGMSAERRLRAHRSTQLVLFCLAVWLVLLCIGVGWLLAWAFPTGLKGI